MREVRLAQVYPPFVRPYFDGVQVSAVLAFGFRRLLVLLDDMHLR
jgi:hypothetical protein